MASIDPYQTPSFTRMTLHLGSTLNASPNSTNVSAKSESLRNNERNNQRNSESRNIFTTPSTVWLEQHLGRSSASNPCRITTPQHTEGNRDHSHHNTPPGSMMLEQHLGIFSARGGQSGNLNITSRQSAASCQPSAISRTATSTDNLVTQVQRETSIRSYSRRRPINRSTNCSHGQSHFESLELESYTQDPLSSSWFSPAAQENSRGGMCIQYNVTNSNDNRNQFSDTPVCQSPASPPPYESLFQYEEIYNDHLVTSENSSPANLHSSFVRPPNENNDTNATVREDSEESISQNESNYPVSSGQVRLSQHLGSAPRREPFWETLERARQTGETVDRFGTETRESNAETSDESFLENISVAQSEESGVPTNVGETEERPLEPPAYSDLKDTWEHVNMSEAELEIYEEEQRVANQNMTSPFYLMAMHLDV